jgi:hypothetical protein
MACQGTGRQPSRGTRPAPLACFLGTHVDDLASHIVVGFRSSDSSGRIPLEFTIGSKVVLRELPSIVSVNAAESFIATAKEGFGPIQNTPVSRAIGAGHRFPYPRLARVSADLHACLAFLSTEQAALARVRVFIDWLIGVFRESSNTA